MTSKLRPSIALLVLAVGGKLFACLDVEVSP